jgi:hypothetical protein
MRALPLALVLWVRAAPAEGAPELPPHAREVAALFGIDEEMRHLDALPPGAEADALRVAIFERVFIASLQLDSVLADLDHERVQVDEARAYQQARHDHAALLYTTAALLVGTGLGAVGSALQLSSRTNEIGLAVSVGTGLAATALGLGGLFVARGGKRPLAIHTALLARPLGRAAPPGSDLPPSVWRYLEAPSPDEPTRRARRDLLVEEWLRLGRIGRDTPAARRKIDRLTSRLPESAPLSTSDLADRSAMLSDVRALVALEKGALVDLSRALR